jgi:murein tripeptide amidase MpaA
MLGKTVLLALTLQAVVGLPVEEKPFDYSQHKLIRIRPKHMQDLERLEELRTRFESKVDYWNHPMTDMRPVLSLMSPEGADFLNALNSSNIKYEIASNNFQKNIEAEREQNELNKMKSLAKGLERAFDYDTVYHTYAEIIAELKALPSQSNKVTYFRVGTTYEGREIPGITVTNPGGSGKKSVILECGIHAREWVSTASCLWIANQLITNTAYNSYLNTYEFVIIPTLNSDGYVFTWTSNRLWRKTRSVYQGCIGADPNRNWDAAFCANGASSNPCSDTYCGQSAFSESESKAMRDLILARQGNVAAYFAIHSYSQLWMYPYGYSNKLPANNAQYQTLSAAAVSAISASTGYKFTAGPIATTIYIASGSSIDWAYDSAGVSIAFALELRDTGAYGFQLPPAQIKAASTETWAGIRAVIDRL